ncbi:Sec-independent protein translocase subunit TatA [Mycolicibacterium sp. HS_4_1]|nr:Sec-independent protein translocase subunit TatA [Actinomycetota bacterium]
MGGLQPWHWLIVIAVFVLLFGAKKLPDAARSLGKSMRIFKSELKEMQSDGSGESTVQPGAHPSPRPITAERVENPAPAPQPAPDATDKHPA